MLHVLGVLLTALLLALGSGSAGAQLERVPVTVVGITDGDTISVRLEGGRTERTRLIGIDTPETKHPSKPVQCYGREAAARTTELALGRAAVLELDVQQRDRYGRLLGYVWIDGAMLNLQLAAEGYAVQSTYPPNVRYVEEFRRAAASAREQGVGLWSACQAIEPPPAEIEPTAEDVPAEAAQCDPSYSTVCIPPPPPDLDCHDIPHRRFAVRPPDPHRFDADGDGIGCER